MWRDVFLATLNNTALRSLVGIDPGRERVPGGTTVLKFRRLFEVSKLGGGLFAKVGEVLQERDFKIGTGAVVDAPPHRRTQLDEECREGVSPRNAPDPQGSAVVFRHDEAHRRGRRGRRQGADTQRGGDRSPQARAAVKRLWGFTKLR